MYSDRPFFPQRPSGIVVIKAKKNAQVAPVSANTFGADQISGIDKEELNTIFKRCSRDGSGGLDKKKVSELLKSLREGETSGEEEGDNGADREKLLNDVMNTGIAAALVGGFALGNIQHSDRISNEGTDIAIYMLSFIAVHACTCSCLTSAMFYRAANKLRDDDILPWMENKALLLKLPWLKFVMGCSSYIVSVIVLSFRALENLPFWRYAALIIGIMSMSTVVASLVLVGRPVEPSKNKSVPSKEVHEEHKEGPASPVTPVLQPKANKQALQVSPTATMVAWGEEK